MKKIFLSLIFLASMGYAATTLAIVNNEKITDEVAPKNFKSLSHQEQQKIVNRLIEQRLACDYALNSGIEKTKEYKKVLEHILGYSKKQKSGNLKDSVTTNETGFTKEQLYSKKGLLAFDFLLEKKAKEMKPSRKELMAFYQKNKYKYDTPHLLELYTIVVDSKKRANMIASQLEKSKHIVTDFSKLAQQYSLAPSKVHGGYFGKIAVDNLNEVLRPHLEHLKQREYTKKPIKTQFGYQLYLVLNNIPKYDSKFDEVSLDVKDAYVKQAVKKWAYDKIMQLKGTAKIKTFI
ncbi:peptidylprolyl isomerase [Sulfurospirillum sp. 1612]|uniref:peptidylprolyl isomerase n=1 Tax=Sulfurospirillum sp. 1612 TaxID=3094835 RepID=UPI002F93C7CC